MSIQLPDFDAQAEQDERLWIRYCAVAKSLDRGELIKTVCDKLAGESTDNPLAELIEDWLSWPQWDWSHPLLGPLHAETVGRYVAGVAGLVIEAAIEQAMSREDDA
jgi:hypothetical protein